MLFPGGVTDEGENEAVPGFPVAVKETALLNPARLANVTLNCWLLDAHMLALLGVTASVKSGDALQLDHLEPETQVDQRAVL